MMDPSTSFPIDPQLLNGLAGILAIGIFVGGFLMMYTTLWTRR